MHRVRHLAVGRPGSDVRRRRLLTVAVSTSLVVGVMIGRAPPPQGAEWWLFACAAMVALLGAVEAADRATEVGE